MALLVACGSPAGKDGAPGTALGGVSGSGSGTAGGGTNSSGGSAPASGTGDGGTSVEAGRSGADAGGTVQSGSGTAGGPENTSGGRDGAGAGGTGDEGGVGGEEPSAEGGAVSSGCSGEKVVHFVYFVEADQTEYEDYRRDIENQAFAFQKYWFDQLGATFYLNEPVVEVIRGDQPAEWYISRYDGIHGDSRWYRLGNIKNEVYRKLGIRDFDPDHRVINYPTTRYDGRVGANFGGAWMDGDDMTCIGSNGVNYPYDDGNSAHCMGHVAHEFGHVLGLDHEGPESDCMQYGFYVPPGGAMCDFSPANVEKIKADPDNAGWFNAMPGQTCAGK